MRQFNKIIDLTTIEKKISSFCCFNSINRLMGFILIDEKEIMIRTYNVVASSSDDRLVINE